MSIYKNGEKYNVVVGNIPSEDNLDKVFSQTIEEIHSTTPVKRGAYLFQDQPTLRIADIVLSEDITSNNAYVYMFGRCTSLTKAPYLPATTLKDKCYYGMFYGCTSLTEAPDLPATELTDQCYRSMFDGCTSLQRTGKIYATGDIASSTNSMFFGCTSLREMTWMATTPPTISAGIWFNCPSDMIIYVPDESVDAYKAASVWSTRATYIKPMSEKPTEE